MMWLATSNDVSAIDAPVLTRFRVFRVDAPTRHQMRSVILSVWRALREAEQWANAFPEAMPEDFTAELIGLTPRAVRQSIEDACMRAALAGRRILRTADLERVAPLRSRAMGFL
jgi:hypothetical protein